MRTTLHGSGTRSLRVSHAVLTGLVTLMALSACSSDDLPNLDSLREKVQQGVGDARSSVDDVQNAVNNAGLNQETLTKVTDATSAATAALTSARTALGDAGTTSAEARENARAGLEDARVQVADAASSTQGPVRDALEALAQQMDELAGQIDEA